jgi:hypothetical protein
MKNPQNGDKQNMKTRLFPGAIRTLGLMAFSIVGACVSPVVGAQSSLGDGASADTMTVNKPEITPEPGMNHKDEVAHPFLTHMGVPDPVGTYSLRLGGTATRADGNTKGDASFHLETGLTDSIGLHLRNDGVGNQQHTEVMFQFAALRSADKMSGFSPLIEFEFPTHSGGDQRINTLVGFSTAWTTSDVAFNQVIHYDPRNEMAEGSASLVVRWLPGVFPVVEIAGEGGRGEKPVVNVLGGLKFQVGKDMLLGIAVVKPTTERKDFSSRVILSLDLEW